MTIRSIHGDDEINALADNAMMATMQSLVFEGIIQNDVAEDFLSNHVCILAESEGGLKRWFKKFFPPQTKNSIVVFQVSRHKP